MRPFVRTQNAISEPLKKGFALAVLALSFFAYVTPAFTQSERVRPEDAYCTFFFVELASTYAQNCDPSDEATGRRLGELSALLFEHLNAANVLSDDEINEIETLRQADDTCSNQRVQSIYEQFVAQLDRLEQNTRRILSAGVKPEKGECFP